MYFRFYESRHICLLAKVARRRDQAEAQCTCSLGLRYKLCAVIPVAGQRTHGTTFRALIVTSRMETPGAESVVYDCFVAVDSLGPVNASGRVFLSVSERIQK